MSIRVCAKNIDGYRRRGLTFIVQGGEKHDATGHSFVAEANYATALNEAGNPMSWPPV